ncbi:MAG: restriction endonuclease subunit S [Rhodocyclaceae bacterium]|nr:restriction endonuclease subunit S [Rhodocyclaceae bacterium]
MSDWRRITLGDLAKSNGCTIQTGPFGSQLHKHEYQADGIGVVNPTHMANRRVSHDSVPCVSADVAARLSKHQVRPGDLLFARRGEIGRHALITESERGWLCGTGCFLVRVNSPESDSTYLSFYLSTDESVEWLNRHAAGVVMPNLSNTVLQRVPVALPPLPEQKKIAHILSTVQRAIEAQERIIQTTTELKKALMHKLFTEGLRNEPQKQTEIGPVPESWEVVPLSDVCRFQSGGTPSKRNPEFWAGTIPWVSPKDMKRPRLADVEDHISQEALESGSKLAPAGSVFVVVRGMILAKTVPVALAEVPMAINQDMKAIVPGPKLRSDFLLYALEALRENLFKKVGRSGHGTCTLMGHEVAAFKIPLPDLAVQVEISSAIQNIERKKELHDEKRKQLQDLFRTLLHELMTAKTRVHALAL